MSLCYFPDFKAFSLLTLWPVRASRPCTCHTSPPSIVRMTGGVFVFSSNVCREEGGRGHRWVCACVISFNLDPRALWPPAPPPFL